MVNRSYWLFEREKLTWYDKRYLVREALQETTAYQGLRTIMVLPTDLCALVAQHVGTRETVKYESGYKPALEVHHVTPGSLAVSRDSNPNNPGQKAFGVLFNPEDMPPTVKNSSMYEIITGKCRLHAETGTRAPSTRTTTQTCLTTIPSYAPCTRQWTRQSPTLTTKIATST